MQTPLRIYTADQKLIAEFGEKRRTPVAFNEIPPQMVQAIMAAEDDRFFEHPGVDIKGLTRAAVQLAQSGRIVSGGSTITMQVAKNFFLSSERAFSRKFNEILLALQIERELSKKEILELYLNKIYLGNRAYGIQAAAQVYYGRPIAELNLAQLAMIAGLPKAPSRFNPLVNPERALTRRDWIIGRMLELGYIDRAQHDAAIAEPLSAQYHRQPIELEAPYIAEMVRQELFERFGADLYTDGYTVITAIQSDLQSAATEAVQAGLLEYDQRHGFRGIIKELAAETTAQEDLLGEINAQPKVGPLLPALVTEVKSDQVQILLGDSQSGTIPWEEMRWARRYKGVNSLGPKPEKPADVLKTNQLVYVQPLTEQRYRLAQLPEVQGALVALSPHDGQIEAIVGGFDFYASKYNRASQASRQVGSVIKPFLYSAALEQGFTSASIINDAPVVFNDRQLESTWRPQNAGGRFYGPTRLRVALFNSRNLVSIRLLQAIGIPVAREYMQRFGFDATKLPENLSLALGSADMTPLEMATAYASIANGGYRVAPYLIKRVERLDEVIFEADPALAPGYPETARTQTSTLSDLPPQQAEQIMEPRVNFIMQSMLRDVVQQGTGKRAKSLGRDDIAGKTGTTNDQKDLWFAGFNRNLLAVSWVGFDAPQPLGRWEYGSTAALPIWIKFMTRALHDQPQALPPEPEGLVRLRIDPESGRPSRSGIFELFREELAPEPESATQNGNENISTEDIF